MSVMKNVDDGDVFSKLSKLLESHVGGDDNSTLDDSAIDNLISSYIYENDSNNFQQTGAVKENISDRPSPFEVWKARQKPSFAPKGSKKLNEQQWDKLIDKMHQSSKLKQNAALRDQNLGFASELGGHDFKPKLNKTSRELTGTMKSLQSRLPEMLEEREKNLSKRREDVAQQEVAECTFHPKLESGKMSEKYLSRTQRSRDPAENLFKFQDEKERRNELRKQIVDEIESKELTFKPHINIKSSKIQAKLSKLNESLVDPVLRFSALTKRTATNAQALNLTLDIEDTTGVYPGESRVYESDHPYKHNKHEYFTICIPEAVRYSIEFDNRTCTENIHDFLKFFKDESHTDVWGAGKYSGGTNQTARNYPGTDGRPPLVIPATSFVVHFHSNGTINDWGYRFSVTPYFQLCPDDMLKKTSSASQNYSLLNSNNTNGSVNIPGVHTNVAPQISLKGKQYRHPDNQPVHDRLYQKAIEKHVSQHNLQVDLIQSKLNIPFRPWETARSVQEVKQKSPRVVASPSLASSTGSKNSSLGEGMVRIIDSETPVVNTLEFNDNVLLLWKTLRTSTAPSI